MRIKTTWKNSFLYFYFFKKVKKYRNWYLYLLQNILSFGPEFINPILSGPLISCCQLQSWHILVILPRFYKLVIWYSYIIIILFPALLFIPIFWNWSRYLDFQCGKDHINWIFKFYVVNWWSTQSSGEFSASQKK